MSIPAIILLIAFSLIFLGLVVMAIVHLFHAWRFGEHTPLAAITSALFLLGIFAITGGVMIFLRDIEWNQSFEVSIPFLTSQSTEESP